jgi:8-oxo-dGTP pyrophosphatase MutT (NUDIX family)
VPAADVPDWFRRSAVLAVVDAPVEHLLLTRRASTLRTHAGEVCLPGGRLDHGETPEQAALREAAEETTLDRSRLHVAGRLDEAWSGAGNVVVPFVARYDGDLGAVRPASAEVDEVLVAPLAALADPRHHGTWEVDLGHGNTYVDDVLTVGRDIVHGLTADLVIDVVTWLEGGDRRRTPARAVGLRHFLTSPYVDQVRKRAQ